jgi:hypothetical protein
VFRVEDGRSITDPKGLGVKAYVVVVEGECVVVYA